MSDVQLLEALRGLLEPYAAGMSVKHDTPDHYYLEEELSSAKPQMFAAVQVRKSYVAFHLFPLYSRPGLKELVSPALARRMQGKSCFNFTKLDQVPLGELESLVRRAFETLPE